MPLFHFELIHWFNFFLVVDVLFIAMGTGRRLSRFNTAQVGGRQKCISEVDLTLHAR